MIDMLLGVATQWQRWLVWAGLIGVTAAGIWFHGYSKGLEKVDQERLELALEKTKLALERGKVNEKVLIRYVTRTKDATKTTDQLAADIRAYETHNPTSVLDARWRVLHDAAARRELPAAANDADGAAQAPTAAAALSTVSANYTACHETADQLEALQDWIKEQTQIRPAQE